MSMAHGRLEQLRNDKHALGSHRWMVWAPDKNDPETRQVGHCTPSIDQMTYAIDLGRALNKRANEGGTWLVAWTETKADGKPKRLAMGWIDRDGDMPFTVDCEDPIEVMIAAGTDKLVAQAHAAFREYQEHIRACEVRPNQMIRQRAGEPMRDPTQIIPAEFG